MFFLVLAILGNTLVPLILKYSDTKNLNRHTIILFNYITATFIGLVMCLASGVFSSMKGYSFSAGVTDFSSNLSGTLTIGGSIFWALTLGVLSGLFALLAMILVQKSICQNGVSLTMMFSKIGTLVPMLLSIVIWMELPRFLQWVGIILAIFSILLATYNSSGMKSFVIKPILLLVFIIAGLADFSSKLFQKYALIEFRSLVLLVMFSVAMLLSLVWVLRSNKLKLEISSILAGSFMGIFNIASANFLIQSLVYLPASVVFPIYSASVIIGVLIISSIIFGEKLQQNEMVAIFATIVSLVLINL